MNEEDVDFACFPIYRIIQMILVLSIGSSRTVPSNCF